MTLTHSQIKNDLKDYASVKFSDSTYVLPAFSYLTQEFLPWFGEYTKRHGMVYSGERFDCDDFAHEFAARLRQAGLGLEEKAGVAVATMQVTNLTTSFEIPKGEHMLNLVGVGLGGERYKWLVIEPQNQKYEKLENYKTANNLRVSF